jgi:oxygen-independent coproporphyrinogen-3 oxidase
MITCVLHGHSFINEVQVMSQVFFPNERFAFCENISAQGYTVESLSDTYTACARIYKNGIELSRFSLEIVNNRYLNERRVIMLTIYHALRETAETYTPWGALTGIRPSKLVREWLAEGDDDEKIIKTLMNPFCCNEEKARLALTAAHAENRIEKVIRGTKAVYISVPFCPTRCVYCSFNMSDKPVSEDFSERYINALISECTKKSTNVSSIYIGGGTPTFLSENLLERLLNAVCENFGGAIEFTAEAGRPDTLTLSKLKILRKYGVNRIAINPQTLNDRTLQTIGRKHTAEEFFTAFKLARETGFNCINTDLIAGLPDETPDDMIRSMEALSKLTPENITIHTLAVKRASRLNEEIRTGESNLISKNVESMLSTAAEYCTKMNLSPYYLYRQKNMVGLFENTGYSLPSYECLYNVGMMAEVQTIIGIGAGAVSKFVDGTKITREFNLKNAELYVGQKG